VTDTYDYDAFGNLVNLTGSTPNSYLYRGEQWDADLGLYYLRARYYNPATGRFLSQDPEAGQPNNPVTFHRYLYGAVDPVNQMDPTGRSTDVEYGRLLPPALILTGAVLYENSTHAGAGLLAATVDFVKCTFNRTSTLLSATNATFSVATVALTDRDCQISIEPGCSESTKQFLQNQVNFLCKVTQRACKGGDDCTTLKAKLIANTACKAARDKLNNTCFDGGDEGHKQASDEAQNAIIKCGELLTKKSCN